MPPAPPKDAIIIVLDVGRSVSQRVHGEDKTFFQQAKNCASWIIQRKLISQSKDVISLLLIGSEDSSNEIAKSGYENINCKFDFQLASWDMLKFIECEVETTHKDSDWLGALIVAMEMLKVYEGLDNIESKKIVFFSDFTHPASDDLDVIVKSIKALHIEITIIGPDSISGLAEDEEYEDDGDDEPSSKKLRSEANKSQERQCGEKLVHQLWRKAPENIWICNFEVALKQLCSYKRKSIRVTPWNCILDIGEVKINISMLKKTDPKSAKTFKTKSVKPPESESGPSTSSQSSTAVETVETVRDKVLHYAHAIEGGSKIVNVEVKPEDTVEGFRYGTTIIPFSKEDKTILGYKTGPKSFSVIGFTPIATVPYYLLTGDCSYIVVPRDKDQEAEVALSAVIQAMKKLEYLGIVRRVYSDDRGLSLGILYPIIEEIVSDETDQVSHKEYLLFVELAFEEDVKRIEFPSLERVAGGLTESQLDAVDNLIDGMSLVKADRGLRGELCEAFELSNLHDFKEQFFHYCVIQRGLYPEKLLPTSLPVHIKAFVKVPKSIEEKKKDLVKEIQKQFKVEFIEDALGEVVEKLSDQQGDESAQVQQHFDQFALNGENNSSKRSWMELFSDSFPSNSDFQMFMLKHANSYQTNEPEFLKTFKEVVGEIRRKYLNANPECFNKWVRRIKENAGEEEGVILKMWAIMVYENLGLITDKENKSSKVSEKDARQFYGDEFNTLEDLSWNSPGEPETDAEFLKIYTDSQEEKIAVDSFY